MTIDKAIEILQHETYLDPNLLTPDIIKAHMLGVEALKAWKEHRGTGSLMSPLLLPGETKE